MPSATKKERVINMKKTRIDGVPIECTFDADDNELMGYIKWAKEKYPNKRWRVLKLSLDGEEVVMEHHFINTPFIRLRRITGYLSDSVNWNNAKQDELTHRVKHSTFKKYIEENGGSCDG